jgi:hypothetical protein
MARHREWERERMSEPPGEPLGHTEVIPGNVDSMLAELTRLRRENAQLSRVSFDGARRAQLRVQELNAQVEVLRAELDRERATSMALRSDIASLLDRDPEGTYQRQRAAAFDHAPLFVTLPDGTLAPEGWHDHRLPITIHEANSAPLGTAGSGSGSAVEDIAGGLYPLRSPVAGEDPLTARVREALAEHAAKLGKDPLRLTESEQRDALQTLTLAAIRERTQATRCACGHLWADRPDGCDCLVPSRGEP